MINDGITSAVYVAFEPPAPDAPTRALLVKDGNSVLPILHGKPDVEDELLERSCLVTALGGIEVGAIVLVRFDGGDHWS